MWEGSGPTLFAREMESRLVLVRLTMNESRIVSQAVAGIEGGMGCSARRVLRQRSPIITPPHP